MSVIAHWIEQQGIHTVVIGLVRLHLEKIQPPRALWVPFELGRPLGAPGNSEFQTDILTAALSMIESDTKTPTIIDYQHDDPRATADENWKPPKVKADSVTDEVQQLQPSYQQHCVKRSRTSVGVAKIPVGESAALIDGLSKDTPQTSAREDISPLLMARFAMDDLKAYYIESALALGNPSSRQVQDWLWQETTFGKKIRQLRLDWMKSDNTKLANLGEKSLVPHRWRDK